jgi:hypothetical protein
MFLIYKIKEVIHDDSVIKVQSEDALFDVFYRFYPEDLEFLSFSETISDYEVAEMFMDCGDWHKGYSTYYNVISKEKYLVINILYDHQNSSIIKLIRDYKINKLR